MIKIDNFIIEGKFSFVASVDRSKNPPVVTVEGLVETCERLPDSFKVLSGGRFILSDILINSESGGSENNTIVYGFIAKSWDILPIKKEG